MADLMDPMPPPGRGRFVGLGVLLAILGLALVVRAANPEDRRVLPSPAPSTSPPVHLVESSDYGTGQEGGDYTFRTVVQSIAEGDVTLSGVVALGPDGVAVPGVEARVLPGEHDVPERLPPDEPLVLSPNAQATLVLRARPDCARPAFVATLRLTYVASGVTRTFVVTPNPDAGLRTLAARTCREP